MRFWLADLTDWLIWLGHKILSDSFKGATKAPKIQHDFAYLFKLTENRGVLDYNSLHRVRLAVVVNKLGLVHPDTWTQN